MKIEHILVPVDFSACSAAALQMATYLASCVGARLTALHVYELGSEADARISLQDFVEAYPREGVEVHLRVLSGTPAYAALDFAKQEKISLIVCGTHGRTGFGRVLLGSFAEKLTRLAHCPVWVARGETFLQPRRILLATDLSPASEPAKNLALYLEAGFGASLFILHVVDRPFVSHAERQELDAFYARAKAEAAALLEKIGIREATAVGREVILGDPAESVADVAAREACDLVVCGTHGRTGFRRWMMGSVAEKVVRLAPCSVIVVPNPENRP